MIAGFGIDVTDARRIERAWRRQPKRFLDHILHAEERVEFRKSKHPARFLAKCFAAKEAFVKALGTGFRGVAHQDIALSRGALGRPQLRFSARLRRKLERMGVGPAHVTLSDEGDLVCAAVVLEKRGGEVP